MDISRFVQREWTEEQRKVYERITGAAVFTTYPNCIAAALGYLGIGDAKSFDPKKAFPCIEGISETTEAPEFGALAVWYSNPISLMTCYSLTTPVRHAGIILGTTFGDLYVFDQMRGSVHVGPMRLTTERVDEISKQRYKEKYTGIVQIKYHPLDAVLKEINKS